MFKQIRTSKKNKESVTKLSRRLNLGAENIIARIAFCYSISKDRKLNLENILDSGGKEYSKNVLFGDKIDTYLGIICCHYNLYITNENIPKYIKMHIDDGLHLLKDELEENSNVDGYDFLIDKLSSSLEKIKWI